MRGKDPRHHGSWPWWASQSRHLTFEGSSRNSRQQSRCQRADIQSSFSKVNYGILNNQRGRKNWNRDIVKAFPKKFNIDDCSLEIQYLIPTAPPGTGKSHPLRIESTPITLLTDRKEELPIRHIQHQLSRQTNRPLSWHVYISSTAGLSLEVKMISWMLTTLLNDRWTALCLYK